MNIFCYISSIMLEDRDLRPSSIHERIKFLVRVEVFETPRLATVTEIEPRRVELPTSRLKILRATNCTTTQKSTYPDLDRSVLAGGEKCYHYIIGA